MKYLELTILLLSLLTLVFGVIQTFIVEYRIHSYIGRLISEQRRISDTLFLAFAREYCKKCFSLKFLTFYKGIEHKVPRNFARNEDWPDDDPYVTCVDAWDLIYKCAYCGHEVVKGRVRDYQQTFNGTREIMASRIRISSPEMLGLWDLKKRAGDLNKPEVLKKPAWPEQKVLRLLSSARAKEQLATKDNLMGIIGATVMAIPSYVIAGVVGAIVRAAMQGPRPDPIRQAAAYAAWSSEPFNSFRVEAILIAAIIMVPFFLYSVTVVSRIVGLSLYSRISNSRSSG